MNNRRVGEEFEKQAVQYLLKQGMKNMIQNFRCKQGEIDIIGMHEGYIVFVEVKYRGSNSKGLPEEAVNLKKQKVICSVATYYLYVNKCPMDIPVRFDVIAIGIDEENNKSIRWYKDAFSYKGV